MVAEAGEGVGKGKEKKKEKNGVKVLVLGRPVPAGWCLSPGGAHSQLVCRQTWGEGLQSLLEVTRRDRSQPPGSASQPAFALGLETRRHWAAVRGGDVPAPAGRSPGGGRFAGCP